MYNRIGLVDIDVKYPIVKRIPLLGRLFFAVEYVPSEENVYCLDLNEGLFRVNFDGSRMYDITLVKDISRVCIYLIECHVRAGNKVKKDE